MFKPGKETFISRHILHQHWYTCPIALPARRNRQHTVVSATSASPFHLLPISNVLERISRPSCESFYITNASYRKQEIFLYEYPLHSVLLPIKKLITERCSSVVYSSSTVAILTIGTSLWTCVCYLDCHEAGLCCYLVIHIVNLLHPL
jgi:hypothetical protein